MRVLTSVVGRDIEIAAERHVHALVHPSSAHLIPQPLRERGCVRYLVEFPISAVEHHLKGNVGPGLNARDSRLCGLDADTSTLTRSLEIVDDELIRAGRGMEIVKGRGGSRGGDQHSDWGKLRNEFGQNSREG